MRDIIAYTVNRYTAIMMNISCIAKRGVSIAEIVVMENVKTLTPMEDSVQGATKHFTTTNATAAI